MADPVLSHLISGKVYGLFGIGNLLEGATVTITHPSITPSISKTTNAQGEYIINLSKLSSQWSVGDEITITASKTAEGTISVTRTILSGGGQTENLTLGETSDFVFDTQSQNRVNQTMTILTHYDGLNIIRTRPLPVQTEDPLEKYVPTDDDFNSDPNYTSFTDRLGSWYIVEDNLADGTHRYVRGSSDYTTNWTNKADLEYDYFYNVF